MAVGSSVVKITAKTALKDNWLKASITGISFISCILVCALSAEFFSYALGKTGYYVSFIIFSLFLILPLFLGLVRFFWRLSDSVDDNPMVLFYYFSERKLYLRALKLAVSFVSHVLIIGLIAYIPTFIVELFSGTHIYDVIDVPIPIWTENLKYIAIILKSIFYVVMIFIGLRYFLAPILIVADENMDTAEAMHLSVVISKNSMFESISLIASLLGWILISILMIPLVFTLPYFSSCYISHSKFIIADYNKHIKRADENVSSYVAGI